MCRTWVEFKNGKIVRGKGNLVICCECGIIEIEEKNGKAKGKNKKQTAR